MCTGGGIVRRTYHAFCVFGEDVLHDPNMGLDYIAAGCLILSKPRQARLIF